MGEVRFRKVWGPDGLPRETARPRPDLGPSIAERQRNGEYLVFDWHCRICGATHRTRHRYGRRFEPLRCRACGHGQELCTVEEP
jgi:hypothetical protein